MNIRQIAKYYNLKVIFITNNNINKYSKKYKIEINDLKNNAEYLEEDEKIILGLYDDKEIRLAALFHEIGHTLVTEAYEKMVNYDVMLIEYQAWIEGLKVANKYKYVFSNKTFKYILTSIHSYYEGALNIYNKPKQIENG